MIGVVICVFLYSISVLLLGVSITAGIFVFHVAVVPIIFKYSRSFRRNLIFNNNVQWPLFIDYNNPSSSGLKGGRNLYIQYESKVDDCQVRIGIWHILSKSSFERLQSSLENITDPDEVDRIYDEELSTSDTPIFLYCHGNSGSRGAIHRLKLYEFFQSMDFHTIAFDYRGYGDSTNIYPSEEGVVEDSLQVYSWIRDKVANKSRTPVFVWGHSLGTGIASHMLGKLDNLTDKWLDHKLPQPNGLILEAPFNNLADEVAKHPLSKLVTWLPYYESTFVDPFRSAPEHTFKSDEYLVKATTLPILILHARDDIIVPFVVGEKLYQAIEKSRSTMDAAVRLYAFETKEGLGHKWICNSNVLEDVVGDFVRNNSR